MPRSASFSLLLALLAAPLTPARAGEASPPDATATATAEPSPTTPASTPRHSRTISDGLAAALAQAMPKYNPPPKPKPEEESDEAVDLREIDKPRNKIIRLPKYVIHEPKPPVFRERDLYSGSNRAGLALERNPGLKYVPFSSLNHAVAAAMYQEQERLDNIADLHDTARTVGVGDKADGAYIKRLTDETYMRSGGDDLGGLGSAWSGLRSQ